MPKPNSRVVIRAFNSAGYHKDIAILDHTQWRMRETRVEDRSLSGIPGVGVSIDPSAFPEMDRFEVIVEEM